MRNLNITDLYYNRLHDIDDKIFDNNYQNDCSTIQKNHVINDLLDKFNLTNLIDNFDSVNNFKDRILLSNLRIIEKIDLYLHLEFQSMKKIDIEIDRRRNSGAHTNLKKSEFKSITSIIYGAKWCNRKDYGENLSAIIFVITKPNDFHLRSLIRQTWAKKFQTNTQTNRLYFAFGRMKKSSIDYDKIEETIRQENHQFNDIIQWDYEEDYYRLTIKSLALIRWTSIYCPLVENVFKVDGDALVNYDNFVKFCQHIKFNQTNHTDGFSIYGNIWNNPAVIRLKKNKFFTSFHDYSKKFYPTYSGSAWLLNGRFNCLFIYITAIRYAMPALLWEDIYITGIIPEKMNKILNIPFKHHQMPGFRFKLETKLMNQCIYNKSIIFTENMKETNLEAIWKNITTSDNNEITATTITPTPVANLGKNNSQTSINIKNEICRFEID